MIVPVRRRLPVRFLRRQVAELVERINGRRVVASVSGGRDSAAMSLYLTELGIEHDRVFFDTGWEHPETYEYLRGELARVIGPVRELRGPHTFVSLVRKKGIFPARNKRFCTEFLKSEQAKAYFADLVAAGEDVLNCVGIRRAESDARANVSEWEWADGFDCEIWRPLVEWTARDVERIHARHGLRMNPLYQLGASRVGCWPCIHARKAEIALVARIDPARIAFIDRLERQLTEEARERAAQAGEPLIWIRTMFSYGGGGRGHRPLPILQAVEWANSGRGEWQPPGAAEGCYRYGLCDTAPEELEGVPPAHGGTNGDAS